MSEVPLHLAGDAGSERCHGDGEQLLHRYGSGSDAGSYLRLVDLVCHSTLGVRVIKKMKKKNLAADAGGDRAHGGGEMDSEERDRRVGHLGFRV